MATQTLSRMSQIVSDKTRSTRPSSNAGTNLSRKHEPVFIPPNEFRMKLLKRILSVDGTIDNKALNKLQKSSSERTLQANILFQNGDVGTVISFDRQAEEEQENEEKSETELPVLPTEDTNKRDRPNTNGEKRERPLKLPPIMLPPIYSLTPRPLMVRDFSTDIVPPPPLEQEDWEDLEDCRYLRPAKRQFKNKDSRSFLLLNQSSGV
ncbi:hypothetical protein ACF0H5_009792 [Mactra antiquata]